MGVVLLTCTMAIERMLGWKAACQSRVSLDLHPQ
jgi:hypothetical protein